MSTLDDAFKLPLTGVTKSYSDVPLDQYNGLTGSYRPYDVYNMYIRDDVVRNCMTLDTYAHHGLK
jgi:hypothetical protein